MPINVSEALDMDTSEVLTVKRYIPGGYVDGLWVEGGSATFKTIASAQQPTPAQLENLTMGERDKDLRTFICKRPVYGTEDRDGTQADEIYYSGHWYKIIQPADWSAYGHTTVIGAKL